MEFINMKTIDELYKYILRSHLDAVSDGDKIAVNGYLNLNGLISLPEGAVLSAGGSLYLNGLTSLPEGAVLSAGGYLNLNGLISEQQVYQGQHIRLRTIDGMCTRLLSKKKVGGLTLWSAQYFKGNLDRDTRCYAAQSGEIYAHGKTAKQAMEDLAFKQMNVDESDAEDLRQAIIERGVITFSEARFFAGRGCRSGTEMFLQHAGVAPDIETMPLADAVGLCRNSHGQEQFTQPFIQAFGG
jgi:hypothetical protein